MALEVLYRNRTFGEVPDTKTGHVVFQTPLKFPTSSEKMDELSDPLNLDCDLIGLPLRFNLEQLALPPPFRHRSKFRF